MGNKELKNRTPISNAIDNDLAKQFNELHETTKIPKSKLLDIAIKLLLDSYKTTE